jgi:hypothetical protein
MSGEFTLEDHSGEIIFASSPGMKSSYVSKSVGPKKAKISSKRINKRPLIEIFDILSEVETDPIWAERFQKMAMYKFPPKISWVSNTTNPDIYGDLVYKNRQITSITSTILKDTPIEEISTTLKFFIRNYTNIEIEGETNEGDDDVKIVSKSKITPMPWSKLTSKDHSALLTDYVKEFSVANSLDKEETSNLLRSVILFAMGRNIVPYLNLDDDGKISKISLIVKDGEKFKLKKIP